VIGSGASAGQRTVGYQADITVYDVRRLEEIACRLAGIQSLSGSQTQWWHIAIDTLNSKKFLFLLLPYYSL
jgi:hypothetical protein